MNRLPPASEALEEILDGARKRKPLIYAITNFVSASFQGDVVMAAGGAPLMSQCLAEGKDLGRACDGLLINTGTPSIDRESLFRKALRGAREGGKITLLDPVGYGAAPFRQAMIDSLIRDFSFTIIKGNYGEIGLLAGMGGKVRGTETATPPPSPPGAAMELARRTASLVVATGEKDYLSDGAVVFSIAGGGAMAGKISGGGCALGALMTTLAAGSKAPLAGALCGALMFRLASERAEKEARGPGTFRPLFIDGLHGITGAALAKEASRINFVKGACTDEFKRSP